MKIQNVLVLGAGSMGNGIAHTFALYNYKTILVDLSEEQLENAKINITKNLDRQVKKDIISPEQKEKALTNLSFKNSLESACEGIDLVVEAITENVNIKTKVFKQLDELCHEDTILASNTSSISITTLGAATNRPEKVIGMHFMNPVPVMKLVEIIKGHKTDRSTTDLILETCEALSKTPISVEDYPGFIANRILMPMINEAAYSLYEGVADVKAIDGIMKLGMGHPMGPLKLADFIGIDVCVSILNLMYEEFGNPKYKPCPLLTKMVNAHTLGAKTKQGFYDYSESMKSETVSVLFKK